MSTWLDDITDPRERAAYRLIGDQDDVSLGNMIRALGGSLRYLNTAEDEDRLAAARYIRRKRQQRKRESGRNGN